MRRTCRVQRISRAIRSRRLTVPFTWRGGDADGLGGTTQGAWAKQRQLERKGFPSDLRNWRFVTLTVDPKLYPNPFMAWALGKRHLRQFVYLLKKKYGIRRWCRKLEFHDRTTTGGYIRTGTSFSTISTHRQRRAGRAVGQGPHANQARRALHPRRSQKPAFDEHLYRERRDRPMA